MSTEPVSLDLDRRSFMKASALAGTVLVGGGATGHALAQEDGSGEPDATDTEGELTKTICNFCAVGCGFHGERKGDAFVGQEPWHEHPVNNGSLCSKGAAIYGSEHSERRLRHPIKKENGEWKKVSWSQAYTEITDEFKRIQQEHSPESVMWLGSAHHSNEEAYAFRKLATFFGTNNVDHQARICHSTTVAGLANTWGYGAMTNTINDYREFDLDFIIGQNPAEAHPIAMQHILEGQARGGEIACVDARFTKTAAHADYFYRIRPGTDVALMMGLMRYLREQGELDQQMLDGRVQGWPDVDAELDQYDLETVSDITWISVEDIKELGDLLIENKPNIQIEWAMGGTQHNNGTQNIRSYALASLATGSAARSGGGLQVMRGHSNVQGATDMAVASHILPGYYGVDSRGSWEWWADVWDTSPWTSGSTSFRDLAERFETMPEKLWRQQQGAEYVDYEASGEEDSSGAGQESEQQFPSKRSMMFQLGLTVSRWYEAALPREDRLHNTPIFQPDPVKAAVFWGHSMNSISEMNKGKKAMENIDLLVVVDMFPSVAGTLPDRDDGAYILPAASQYEHHRSVTNSHRSVQWSEPVRPPSHNSRPDMRIIQEMADYLGFGDHFDWGNGPELYNGKTTYEDALREINLGTKTIGYCQSPERLQQHLEYDWAFSTEDLKARASGTPVDGDYWMLPWPCWGEGHPGTPIIWRDDLDPREGGHDFRTRWGVRAPTPQEWDQMPTGQPYPLEQTVQQSQQQDAALNMLRESYTPDWNTDYNGQVHGVPQYPGFTTTMPDDPENPDALTLPYRYALDPERSVYDCAQAMAQRGRDIDPAEYAQYDHAQPDPPTGRGKARGVAWNFIDTVPVHREPIESPRPDLVEEWPANGKQINFYRMNQNNRKTQQEQTQLAAERGFNTVMTTGRQVEHQGGGAESRSNIFLADLQPHMYAEIHPEMAENLGVDGGDLVVVQTTDRGSILVKARVTHRVKPQETFLPFHWGGIHEGKSYEDRYPEGNKPFVIGDSANTVTVRGYDVETQMQETKAGLVQVEKANQSLLNELNMDVDLKDFEFPQDKAEIGTQKDFDVRDYRSVQ